MTNSQKGAIWIVGLAMTFLALAWLGQAALIAAIAALSFRVVVLGGMLVLIGAALRKAG